ncbi:amino acid/amide ABC transporter substrate-binding protein, HAAT family [Kaistia soli DSM 19436]|uniref:Amino acid/amide ABC transporter substrate-binding protein, HAAT family n=1 Tax=Kaistia soli DSM 19436 TaxID=1122133 RepID=A0A1M5AE06_9HYPH|nr:branched-chain amino acid ABC transporter substrate-binding protein [Kaistia soli]SHF28473.1 amino acid/amide ABC transporter substrate-binding protein, HAAT family [Kaistia soli DSM 19436]
MRRFLLLALCTTAFAGVALADIRIAVIAPLSGPYQTLGQEIKSGAARAVAELNAAGGIDGQTVRLDVSDDICRADTAATAAAKAAARGDVFVVGHVCAAEGDAAAAVYADKGILAISPAITANDFTDHRPGPSILRLAARDDAQGTAAGAFLAKAYGKKRIAVVSDGSPYGKALAEAVVAGLNAAGVKEARSDSFEPGAKDYAGLVDVMIDDDIGVLYVAGYDGDAALIAAALKARRSDIVLMGGDALATSEFGNVAGPAAMGTLMTFYTDWRSQKPAEAVAAAFRADDVEPRGFVLPAYAAVQLFAAARKATHSAKGGELAAWLGKNTVDTVLGPVAFDAKGDTKLPGFGIYRWGAETFEPLPGS